MASRSNIRAYTGVCCTEQRPWIPGQWLCSSWGKQCRHAGQWLWTIKSLENVNKVEISTHICSLRTLCAAWPRSSRRKIASLAKTRGLRGDREHGAAGEAVERSKASTNRANSHIVAFSQTHSRRWNQPVISSGIGGVGGNACDDGKCASRVADEQQNLHKWQVG